MTAGIVLGTAQFGAAYGATNTRGRLSDEEVRAVVAEAMDSGVAGFDTAIAYGDAEQRLGAALGGLGMRPRVVTKLRLDDVGGGGVADTLARSRRRLGVERVDVLLHRSHDVREAGFPAFRKALLEERAAGRVGAVGVSVYDATELEQCHAALPELTLVQVPGSLVDRRLLSSPIVARLAAAGVEVHVRSVFLQGLLLLPPDELPARFSGLRETLEVLDARAGEREIGRIELVLASVVNDPLVDAIVVGATSAEELRRTVAAARAVTAVAPPEPVAVPEDLVDPRYWR